MVGRVVLGLKQGVYGLFVSPPGVEVTTAPNANLLISTTTKNLQVIARGSFTSSGGNANISWPAAGFRPRLLVSSQLGAYFTYTSDNSATISVSSIMQTQLGFVWGIAGTTPTLSTTIYWMVLSSNA